MLSGGRSGHGVRLHHHIDRRALADFVARQGDPVQTMPMRAELVALRLAADVDRM